MKIIWNGYFRVYIMASKFFIQLPSGSSMHSDLQSLRTEWYSWHSLLMTIVITRCVSLWWEFVWDSSFSSRHFKGNPCRMQHFSTQVSWKKGKYENIISKTTQFLSESYWEIIISLFTWIFLYGVIGFPLKAWII